MAEACEHRVYESGSVNVPALHALSRATRFATALLSALALTLFAACASAERPEHTSEPVEPVTIPASAVGEPAQWVLDQISGERVSEGAEFDDRFDQTMFVELSPTELRAVFEQMRAAGPWQPIAYEGTEQQARVTIESSDATYDMTISVTEEGLINGLFFGEQQAERTPAASWEELEAAIDGASYDVSLQIAPATDGGSEAERRLIGPSVSSPIGSIFKLWVLGAVVDAIESGKLSWEHELTIDAEVRSLPSGELQKLPDGARVSVREAAEKMIRISDNTATDALIRAVGREAVEFAMADMGHANPGDNKPFLTTRELFWMLFGDDSLRERWAAAGTDAAARAAVLAEVPSGVPSLDGIASAEPGWPEGADWFATHDDLVRAHSALQERAATTAGAPVREILAENPGLSFGPEWDYVAFKGGSSIGVLAGSWYLERAGKDPLVVTVLARAGDAQTFQVSASQVFGFVQDAVSLLASE